MANPAPSTPPTDAETILATLRRLGLIGTPEHMSAVEDIKKFCRTLSTYNISRVTAEYDGSGDSGDIYSLTATIQPTQVEIDRVMQNTTQPHASMTAPFQRNLETWLKENVFDKPGALITKEQFDDFQDNLFSLLPGGWEINEGSFGVIKVHVTEESIELEHNERIMEVRTETMTF